MQSVSLQDTLSTGQIKIGGFYDECSLHLPADSMLIVAFAGFNIEQAVIYKVAIKTLNQDTKGRTRKCFMELEF